jgi:hypothetical protein
MGRCSTWSVPRSLADLFACFQGCFAATTFQTFTVLVAGFLAQTGLRTVAGIRTGAAGRSLTASTRDATHESAVIDSSQRRSLLLFDDRQ